MKFSNRHYWLLAVLIFTSCSRKDEGVRTGSSFRWRELINVHESSAIWISVNGEKFEGVRGRRPYHLEIPEIDGVFFVTKKQKSTNYDCHFYLFREKRDIVIQAESGYLGGGIGYPKDASVTDWVESVKWPKVVVVHRNLSEVTRYTFDLDHRTMKIEMQQPTEAETGNR